jgi:hypothetical protein
MAAFLPAMVISFLFSPSALREQQDSRSKCDSIPGAHMLASTGVP